MNNRHRSANDSQRRSFFLPTHFHLSLLRSWEENNSLNGFLLLESFEIEAIPMIIRKHLIRCRHLLHRMKQEQRQRSLVAQPAMKMTVMVIPLAFHRRRMAIVSIVYWIIHNTRYNPLTIQRNVPIIIITIIIMYLVHIIRSVRTSDRQKGSRQTIRRTVRWSTRQ